MLRTRATRRCSTAPAEALHTAGVTSAARRSGITTPAAPAHSAVRQIEPRFCGSWTWSSATSSGSSPDEQLIGARRRGRRRPARTRPDGRPSRSGARSPPPRRRCTSHAARATARARRPAVAHTSPTLRRPAPAQRLADGVAPVEDHSGQELEALGPVADLPAERGDLLAQAVGGGEVALAAGLLALLGQLAHRRRAPARRRRAGPRGRARRASRAGARRPEHPVQRAVASRIHSFSTASASGVLKSRASASKKRSRSRLEVVAASRPATAAVPPRGCGSRWPGPAPAPPPRTRAAGGSARRSGTSRPPRARSSPSTSCSGAMLPTDLAIFSPVNWIMPLCIHSFASSCPARRARLGGLVLVVGEHQVRAAAVDVEADAEQLLGHRRALDVPAGRPGPQGESQSVSSPSLCAFHSAKSSGSSLRSAPSTLLALVHVLEPPVREAAVAGVRAHAEVHVAARRVGVPGLDQRRDVGRRSAPSSREASGSWSGRPRPSASVSAR